MDSHLLRIELNEQIHHELIHLVHCVHFVLFRLNFNKCFISEYFFAQNAFYNRNAYAKMKNKKKWLKWSRA